MPAPSGTSASRRFSIWTPGRTVRARPDGYTIEIGFRGTHVLNGGFYSLPYDLVNDFMPISPVFTSPLVFFAKKTMPANDLRELIAWLKANPNKASAAVYAADSRLSTALFQKETGTQFAIVRSCLTGAACRQCRT